MLTSLIPLLRVLTPALVLLSGLAVLVGCDGRGEALAVNRGALTQSGEVVGVASPFDPEITVYRGIPYAAPPVGERRWQPPRSAESWQQTLEASRFAASCYQPRHTSTFVWRREDFEVSEDCLYLNVWAPLNGAKLPVMVWFHGGSHSSGQGHSLIFDGTTLASQGVVLITINYRLGPFGFLAHPWLAEESAHGSAGNYGLLDKIAALEWVGANAEAFGGDPQNITIFGQSAGSQSVCSLMASPLADGLFHKAIGQSAGCAHTSPLNAAASRDANGHQRGERLVDALGVTDVDALRAADPEALLAASTASAWENESRITLDGWVLPEAQQTVFAQGRQAPVPLLLGYMADEGMELLPKNEALTMGELEAFAAAIAGDKGKALINAYATEDAIPGDLQFAMTTDWVMAFGMRRWAEYQARLGQPTYLYYVDHVPPAFHIYMPENPDLPLPGGPRSGGAYHSGDLALVFGTTDKVGLDWIDKDHQVSRQMVRYWTNFAKTGDPNGEDLTMWPRFDGASQNTLVISPVSHSEPGVDRERLDLMGSIWPM